MHQPKENPIANCPKKKKNGQLKQLTQQQRENQSTMAIHNSHVITHIERQYHAFILQVHNTNVTSKLK